MLSNVTHAESITYRARFLWLGAALAATVALFALSLGDASPAPASPRKPRVEMRSKMCGEARAARDHDRSRLERKIERAKERTQHLAERAERRAARAAERAQRAEQRAERQAERAIERAAERAAERATRVYFYR